MRLGSEASGLLRAHDLRTSLIYGTRSPTERISAATSSGMLDSCDSTLKGVALVDRGLQWAVYCPPATLFSCRANG